MSARREASAWRFWRTVAQCIIFSTIEIMAARALDGWLAIALYLIAAWNIAIAGLGTVGISLIATNAINGKAAKP